MKLIDACKAFWAVLTGAELVPLEQLEAARKRLAEIEDHLTSARTMPDRFSEGAVYALVLLQREGRLVDFLKEDIGPYDDAQVGAAVRRIHDDCAKCLDEHFRLEPVRGETEGSDLTLDEADPYVVKLTGDVPASGPYRGTLRHQGWRAAKVNLPERSDKVDPNVIQPAELEI